MSRFNNFKEAVKKQLDRMCEQPHLYRTEINSDSLWETYLESFPAGSNPIFRERTEHDCQCCKNFIRDLGNVVAIINGTAETIWDITVDVPYYQCVADEMAAAVKDAYIDNVFYHYQRSVGSEHNHQLLPSGASIQWDHFHYVLPEKFVLPKTSIDTQLSVTKSNFDVLRRTLREITPEAVEMVSDLIGQGSLYRGDEHKSIVEKLSVLKSIYDSIKTGMETDRFIWKTSMILGNASKIRNTVIGTLLGDISKGVELDVAVKKFEDKVAPTNYKRPTALVTQKMVDSAQAKVKELGIEDSLYRRHATMEDLTINNVLFADRSAKETMGVFDGVATKAVEDKSFDKVEEVSVKTFVESILPKAESIEVLVENRHVGNFVSLLAPTTPNAEPIFKWGNNFTWAYAGEVTDSIKERVKRAGGSVDGVLRCSLSWYNYDDLDIHVIEPGGNEIYFGNSRSRTLGRLDVDMNAGSGTSRNAVENVTWPDKSRMLEGVYAVIVHNYSRRETIDVGFEVEIEYEGSTRSFNYNKAVPNDGRVTVAQFRFDKMSNELNWISSLPSTQHSKEEWGIVTQQFHKVSAIMNSPNHWDGEMVGNKHLFFILEKCKNDKPARGFFNEFLKEELRDHRKVFEVLGSKLKAEVSDNQLSGVGFSSTQRNDLLVKVKGSFNRTIKVTF